MEEEKTDLGSTLDKAEVSVNEKLMNNSKETSGFSSALGDGKLGVSDFLISC